jgi:DNA-directed RNA polymerase subunit N (RpoN/RPB10)
MPCMIHTFGEYVPGRVERKSTIQERDLMLGMDTAKEVAKQKTFVASFSKFRNVTKFCVRRILLSHFNDYANVISFHCGFA